MIIDWNQLELNSNNAKEISFERFCFHYASILFKGYGEMTYPYNAAGSEFYLELLKPMEYEGRKYRRGDIIGWQAKFWVNHNDFENSSLDKSNRNELLVGFKNTLKRHKNLALWVVCTPGQFVEDCYNKLRTELAGVSDSVVITHWHKAVFEASFVGEDGARYQGLLPYYFGKKVIGKNQLDRLTSVAIESLKQKFDVDLHSTTPFEEQLMGIIDKNKAYSTLIDKTSKLKKRVEQYEKRWYKDDGTRYLERLIDYGEAFVNAFLEYEACVLTIAKEILKIIDEKSIDCVFKEGILYFDSKREIFEGCAHKIKELIRDLKGINGDDAFYFYIRGILEIKCILIGRPEDRSDSIEHTLRLRETHYFPVFAQAGYGKTHFACSLATEQLKTGQPVLLLTGSKFRHCTRPQEAFISILGMERTLLSFEDIVWSLDLLASYYPATRLLIIIDGLNESFPNERVWADELPSIVKYIEESENLVLVTTCREKSEYIQKIYGLKTYDMVNNSSLLKGINDINLTATIYRYFRKYSIDVTKLVDRMIFKNPLLLKIFCETNRGAVGVVVNEHSLVESMKRYSDNLVSNLSVKDGAENKVISYKVRKGLIEMGRLLWERNTREVDYFEDFYPLFVEKAEDLLDEGLCFQVETLNTDGGKVKFSYDLMAGYHIAQYLLSNANSEKELIVLLNDDIVHKKLFGIKDNLHTLSEDILKTLIYAVRERGFKSIFEYVESYNAFTKILENIELIKATEEESNALMARLSQPQNEDVKRCISILVKDKLFTHYTVGGISMLLPAFKQFTSEDFDLFFHEQFLLYGTIFEAVNCVKNAMRKSCRFDDVMMATVLLSGCFWKENRQEIIRLMIDYSIKNFNKLTALLPEYLQLSDPYIKEALYVLMHGITVGISTAKDTTTIIRIIKDDLTKRPTSNILILDYVESLFDYAKKVYSINVDDSVLFLAKDVKWGVIKEKEIWKSAVYDYDYEKFHIRPYSVMGYNSHTDYTSDQLTDMILWRMRKNGYNDEIYADLIATHRDRMKYYQTTIDSIPFKYVGTAQKELVGWLMLNGVAKPEYKNTMRTQEIDIDPSYPSIYPKRQLISSSFLPLTKEDKEKWLVENPLKEVKKYLKIVLRGAENEWILLRGRLNQKHDEKEVQIYCGIESGLSHNKCKDKKIELHAKSHSHLFASEIGWREMEYNGEDYYESSNGVYLLQHYEFTGWSSTRAKNHNFYFIADHIRRDLGLVFNVRELKYYRNGESVTEYYKDNHSEFYYIRKDLLEEIQKRYEVTFVIELFAEKTDTHRDDGRIGYGACKRYKERIIGLKNCL